MYRQSHLGLTFAALVAVLLRPGPAGAQVAVPDMLPGPPAAGYGGPASTLGGIGSANATGLVSPFAGVAGLPTTGIRGPALLFQPTASAGLLLTDNVRQTPTHRAADADLQLTPGFSILADMPRFQGSLAVSGAFNKYVVASDLDSISGALFGGGVATIVPDTAFVDVRSSLSAASTSGGVGFTNVSQLPQSQQTQVFTNTVSPYYRKAFGDFANAELRYRFSSTNFFGNPNLGSTTVPAFSFQASPGLSLPTASDSISHEGLVTIASGERYSKLSSRLTLDGVETEGGQVGSTQLSGYDDVQYQITDTLSATGRLGYERIRYPNVVAANFSGVTYLIGGQAEFGPRGYLSLQYGRQQGSDGLTGSGRYDIAPSTSVSMSVTQGTSSTQQQITNALTTASVNAGGVLINQNTGQPLVLVNPQFGLQNVVYRYKTFSATATSVIKDNNLSLTASYNTRSSESTVTGPSTGYGLSLGWTRSLAHDLTSNASISYSTVTNATLGTIAGAGNNNSSYSANVGLTYLLGYSLTGSVVYSFIYENNPIPGIAFATAQSGSVLVNQLQFTITKAF